MSKFTFKKDAPMTGLAGVGYPYSSVDVKLGGKVVGMIHAPNWQTDGMYWQVGLKVVKTSAELEKEPSCPWRWAFFSQRHFNEQAARDWLLNNQEALLKKYTLWKGE
jgi:hypothetical protein